MDRQRPPARQRRPAGSGARGAACELSPPTSTPPIRTPGAMRSLRPGRTRTRRRGRGRGEDDEEPEDEERGAAAGATALGARRLDGRAGPHGPWRSRATGCHTIRPVGGRTASRRGPFAQASDGKRTIMTTKTDQVPRITLRGETEIPQLGFGVFQVPPEDTAEAVTRAFADGLPPHRHRRRLPERGRGRPGVPRLRPRPRGRLHHHEVLQHRPRLRARRRHAFKQSLERLGLDYVDLYLIHWPVPSQDRTSRPGRRSSSCRPRASSARSASRTSSPTTSRRIVDETGVTPAVNQVELHPRLQQAGLRREHADRGIVTEAWSPLAQGAVLDDPVDHRDRRRRTTRRPARSSSAGTSSSATS